MFIFSLALTRTKTHLGFEFDSQLPKSNDFFSDIGDWFEEHVSQPVSKAWDETVSSVSTFIHDVKESRYVNPIEIQEVKNSKAEKSQVLAQNEISNFLQKEVGLNPSDIDNVIDTIITSQTSQNEVFSFGMDINNQDRTIRYATAGKHSISSSQNNGKYSITVDSDLSQGTVKADMTVRSDETILGGIKIHSEEEKTFRPLTSSELDQLYETLSKYWK